MRALDVDFARARRFMRDGQLTPNGVTDTVLLDAMEAIPREAFLPPGMRDRAYADEAVPLPGGRALMAPMVLARLLQMALPQPGERVLVLAAGTGYGAAVLARMGLRVLGIESDAALASAARQSLQVSLTESHPEIEVGDPRLGAPPGAPFRLILIEGAVDHVPQALFAQLAEGGRLVTIRRMPQQRGVGRAVLYRRIGGAISEIEGLDAAAPLLAEFATPPGFIL